MQQSRRFFMRGAAMAAFGFGAAPHWMARAADASVGRKKVLVAVFQRGAADGLNVVAPVGDAEYAGLRPTLAVSRREGLALDDFFVLNPAMEGLKKIWDEKKLMVVHAAGSPDPTRSHFDAQDYMESGTPGRKATRDGWLNRALPAVSGGVSPVRAVAMGPVLPRALRGQQAAVAVNSIGEFGVKDREAQEMFQTMYAQSGDTKLKGAGKDTFEAVRLLEALDKEPYTPGADYPNSKLGRSMQQIARLIKKDVGLEVAFAETTGWDTHVNEANALPGLLRDFSQSLFAFYSDLGARMDDVAVVTMSEFGRTARENGNRGTDHGHANVMFGFGGGVAGGLRGHWPGLKQEQLYEGRDLAVTTDFRNVLSEMVRMQLGVKDVGRVFPGFVGS